MHVIYEGYMWSMILFYNDCMQFMMLIYDGCVLS